nr:DUF3265 domain-containing protein [Vibrio nigripulchritudo]
MTSCLRLIRNAWHFCYSPVYVFKVLRCSHLGKA